MGTKKSITKHPNWSENDFAYLNALRGQSEGDAQLAESNETHSTQPMSSSQQLEWLLVPSDQSSKNICVPITGSKLTVGLVNVTDLGSFLFPLSVNSVGIVSVGHFTNCRDLSI
ncbi:hypothetical protein CEXT_808161 [Caerostris extrusa]|uniref:Uncharacterized protein n=1 Tax=Caerostris extrusa TaxID=172846 RepID=A0AAV4S6P3_CAEEX|nr:hypothetical protein CEXT_808161 [Caerostris extrusa]